MRMPSTTNRPSHESSTSALSPILLKSNTMSPEISAIQSPDAPNLSGEFNSMPQVQTPIDGTTTHYSHDVKLHADAVQLFVSTQNHLYDTRRVELEENTWQCKGTMSDESIQGLTKAIQERGPRPGPRTEKKAVRPSFQSCERQYGSRDGSTKF
jgi:hypothetical protein